MNDFRMSRRSPLYAIKGAIRRCLAIQELILEAGRGFRHGDPASLDLSHDDLLFAIDAARAELEEALELLDALARSDEQNRPVSDVGLAYFSRVDL